MPLNICIKCDGCGKEFGSEEIYRIAEVHRSLTRVSRRVTIELTCQKCGRKVGSRTFKEKYICPKCIIVEEKIKNPPQKGGRKKGSKNKPGVMGRPEKEIKPEIMDFIKANMQEGGRNLSKVIEKKFNTKIHFNTIINIKKGIMQNTPNPKQKHWKQNREDDEIMKEIEEENLKLRQEGY